MDVFLKVVDSSMPHATTASPKPSFRAPWRVNKAMVGRGNAGGTTSNSGHPFLCQNCSQWPVAEKTGRRSLPNRFSCRSRDKTELYHVVDSTLCSFFYTCVHVMAHCIPIVYLLVVASTSAYLTARCILLLYLCAVDRTLFFYFPCRSRGWH